jgi:prophage tail gpP-like protein
MPTVERIRNEKLLNADNERLSILISGKKILVPESFTFTEYFDACSDSFEIEHYPKEKNSVLNLVPGGLEKIQISILGEGVLSGNVEIISTNVTQQEKSISFSGRNSTRILEKSALPENIQREFVGMSLADIARVVCSAFNLDVSIDSGVNSKQKFERATYEDSQSAYDFLSRLCLEVGAVLTNTNDGRPLITKAKFGNPVAKFDIDNEFIKFLGIEGISTTYDSTKLFGTYIGKTQTPKSTINKSTAKSKVITENSIKYLNFDDSTAGTLKNMVATAERKAVREFFENSIPYPSWLNIKSGERWKTGQTIVINATGAYIDNQEVLITKIEFKKMPDSEIALLYFKPVETYQ